MRQIEVHILGRLETWCALVGDFRPTRCVGAPSRKMTPSYYVRFLLGNGLCMRRPIRKAEDNR